MSLAFGPRGVGGMVGGRRECLGEVVVLWNDAGVSASSGACGYKITHCGVVLNNLEQARATTRTGNKNDGR
ncbi:MAG: hypothetical protein EBQ80_06550 [Proteobacteria bacterium]|nr:hypothetical protein [Pseudomonadota bacterium]